MHVCMYVSIHPSIHPPIPTYICVEHTQYIYIYIDIQICVHIHIHDKIMYILHMHSRVSNHLAPSDREPQTQILRISYDMGASENRGP